MRVCIALQVHVYLPSKEHPAHDTVRAIVKDSTDNFSGDNARVFVDSGNPLLLHPLTGCKSAAWQAGILRVQHCQDAKFALNCLHIGGGGQLTHNSVGE